MSLKLTVGDLTIHRIIEQETTYLPALEMLPGLTPELLAENRPWMQKAGALDASDVLILCFQSYIVKTPHHTILVDSCIGNDKPRQPHPKLDMKWDLKTDDIYMRALAAAGFSVGDIDFVMCTHLHVDHIGWNTRLEGGRWVPTFPNARYVFGKEEFDYWTEQNAKAPVPPFGDSVLPIVEAKRAEIVRNDYAIGDHARILPTPGHTPGHAAFTFGRGRDDAVVSGDLVHSPLQARYPELSMKFDVDQAQAAVTRRSFLERYCDTDTLCCTAHFPSPSSGKIRRWGNGFSCEAVAANWRWRSGTSIKQTRRVIDDRAFDGEHFELGHNAAIGGKSAGLAAGGEHAVARHHDRTGIAPERLADIARQLDAAEPFGDIAVGQRLARRNGAGDIVDAAVELRNAVKIEHDFREIVRLAREQLDDSVDCVLHLGRRRHLRDVAITMADAGAGLVLAPHRQLHRVDAARAPRDAAAADRGVE
jgi:glyoxylase-like metal-dependent hydrolase (beta-lactamase superfamily II)